MDVLALLDSKEIHYERKGDQEYAVVCPNQHNHAGGVDSRPSFSIHIEKLVGHCLACGYKLGEKGLYRWLVGGEADDLLMQCIGIKAAVRRIEAESQAARPFLQEAEEFTLLPSGKLWTEDYRGIPASLFQELKCRHCVQGYFANRLILPIHIYGRLRGFESRDLGKSEKLPKYLRSKGFDSLREGLFPYDYVRAMRPKYVLLCEGVFDALNAVSKGFPALCIFGTRSFSMEKFSRILATGCSEVVFCLDNDKAGNGAEPILIELIKGWVDISIADKSPMVDGKDLGDLTRDEIEHCLKYRRRVK